MGSDGHNRQPHLPNVISSWFARRDRAHTGRHAAGVAGRRQTAMMSPTARGLTEIDREPPIGVFLFAESYFQAARHLQKERDVQGGTAFDAPIYYLYCHALELAMKALPPHKRHIGKAARLP